jgi:hypothetical protein
MHVLLLTLSRFRFEPVWIWEVEPEFQGWSLPLPGQKFDLRWWIAARSGPTPYNEP